MIQPLSGQHINEVSEIHLSSWASHEISVKLGKEYVRDCFYYSIAKSKLAFGYVYVQDGRVIAYATGYWDYKRFFEEMKRAFRFKIAKIVLVKLLRGRIAISDVLNILSDHRILRNLKFPAFHQNALALSNEYKGTDAGRMAVVSVINRVVEQFIRSGCPGCWGVTDARNVPMRKYYIKLGFEKVDIVNQFGRTQVVFEKIL